MKKEELIVKIKNSKSKNEIKALLKENKDELSDSELEYVNGGGCTDTDSGDTPKFIINEIVGINYGYCYAWFIVDSVSLTKEKIDGYNVFYYSLTELLFRDYDQTDAYRSSSKLDKVSENALEKVSAKITLR